MRLALVKESAHDEIRTRGLSLTKGMRYLCATWAYSVVFGCGQGWIRTSVAYATVLQTASFNHSDTCPKRSLLSAKHRGESIWVAIGLAVSLHAAVVGSLTLGLH